MQFRVIKKNKRLWIEDETGKLIYTPPDYIRHLIKSREQLQEVADKLSAGADYITEIVEFQTRMRP